MSLGNKKRKRDDIADRPAKVHVLEQDRSISEATTAAKAKGQSRQAKSERRSKRAPKGTSRQKVGTTTEPELLTSTPKSAPTIPDNLANGDDFVSLSADAEQVVLSKSKNLPENRSRSQKKSKSTQSGAIPGGSATDEKANDRFILFIGNLPYAATIDSITTHFSALQPFTVRHSTDKNTGRSKGFAFLEFENYDRMKTCLKLYHHSIFDPETQVPEKEDVDPDSTFTKRKKSSRPQKEETNNDKPRSKNARKINVELTAGGGGKGKYRKGKIEEKNKKLTEERERRYAKEAAEKAKTEHKTKERPATGANADGSRDDGDHRGNIHPSRRKRVVH